MAINKDYKPTQSGVKVLTWGMEPEKSNGMLHFLDATLFGGNVGHAAVKVTFPADAEGDRLIAEYCEGTKIPYTKRKYTTKTPDGEEVYSEEVYEVYWSWWPPSADGTAESPARYDLNEIELDTVSEWEGVDFEWDPKWKEVFDPEERRHAGLVGQTIMTYGPRSIIHGRDLSDKDKETYKARQQMEDAERRSQALNILESRLGPRTDKKTGKSNVTSDGKIILDSTSKILLDKYIKDWKNTVSDPRKLSKDEVSQLKTKVEKVREGYQAILDLRDYEFSGRVKKAIDALAYSQPLPMEGNVKIQLEKIKDNIKNKEDKAWVEEILKNPALESDEDKERVKKICTDIQEDARKNPQAANALKGEIMTPFLEELSALKSENRSVDIDEWGIPPDTFNDRLEGETWRSILGIGENDEKESFTNEEITKLYNRFKKVQDKLSAESVVFRKDLVGWSLPQNKDAYLTEGLPPEGVVSLPIKQMSGSNIGVQDGLDVEGMLRHMKEISDPESPAFDLYTKNCSKTTDSILEAGAGKAYQKEFFRTKAWGFFGNPQESYNNAMEFLKALESGKPNIFSRITDPLTLANGTLLGIIIAKDATVGKKVGAAAGIFILAPFTLTVQAIKGLTNPLETFRSVMKLMEFATTKPFKGAGKILQGVIIFTAGVTGIIYAPFALIQKAIVTTLAKISEVVNHVNPKMLAAKEAEIKAEQERAKFESLEPKVAIQLQSTLDSLKITEAQIKKSIQQLTVEVVDMNPQKALAEFSAILKADPSAIPSFSKDANAKLLAYIKKHPEDAKVYQEISAESLKRVTTAQKAAENGKPLQLVNLKQRDLTIHKDTLTHPEKTATGVPKATEPETKPIQPTPKGPPV